MQRFPDSISLLFEFGTQMNPIFSKSGSCWMHGRPVPERGESVDPCRTFLHIRQYLIYRENMHIPRGFACRNTRYSSADGQGKG